MATSTTPSPGQHMDRFFNVFMLLIAIGVVGNVVNLSVFSMKSMRTKTSCFLCAMAAADICFFLNMFVIQLGNIEELWQNQSFMFFFVYAYPSLITLLNYFSAASIWLAVGVTIERVVAVRYPLHVRIHWSRERIICAVVMIFILVIPLTFYHYAISWVEDDGNRIYVVFVDQKKNPERYLFCQVCIYMQMIFVVIIPSIVLIILNVLLVHHVRLGNKSTVRTNQESVFRMRSNERKVTITVIAILYSFLLLNLPSAVMFIWCSTNENGLNNADEKFTEKDYLDKNVADLLVTLGKSLNFILYYSLSSEFRRKCLVNLCHCKRLGYRRPPSYRSLFQRGADDVFTTTTATTTTNSMEKIRRSTTKSSLIDSDKASDEGKDTPQSCYPMLGICVVAILGFTVAMALICKNLFSEKV